MPRVSIRKLFLYLLAVASTALLVLNIHQTLIRGGPGDGGGGTGARWYLGGVGSGWGPSAFSGTAGRPGHVGLVENSGPRKGKLLEADSGGPPDNSEAEAGGEEGKAAAADKDGEVKEAIQVRRRKRLVLLYISHSKRVVVLLIF